MMEFENSIIGKAMGMLDALRAGDKRTEAKSAAHPKHHARTPGREARVAAGKEILKNPPGK